MTGFDMDMSDAFDGNTAGSFEVNRRRAITNDHGRDDITNLTFEAFGTICAASPNDLQRLPEDQRMMRAISVITQFMLQGPTPNYQPDTVLWNGSPFVVVLLEPYDQYGPGFIQAVCVSMSSTDAAPYTRPAFGFGDDGGSGEWGGFGIGYWSIPAP